VKNVAEITAKLSYDGVGPRTYSYVSHFLSCVSFFDKDTNFILKRLHQHWNSQEILWMGTTGSFPRGKVAVV